MACSSPRCCAARGSVWLIISVHSTSSHRDSLTSSGLGRAPICVPPVWNHHGLQSLMRDTTHICFSVCLKHITEAIVLFMYFLPFFSSSFFLSLSLCLHHFFLLLCLLSKHDGWTDYSSSCKWGTEAVMLTLQQHNCSRPSKTYKLSLQCHL